MPPMDGWSLIARIAAQRERFDESAAIAESAAFLILRNQLMLGVQSATDLRSLAQIVGAEAMGAVIRALAPYELRRILANANPAATANMTTEEARHELASLANVEPGAWSADELDFITVTPLRPMRRHKALGARRIRAAG